MDSRSVPPTLSVTTSLVGPINATTDITGTVTDSERCPSSDTITLTVNPLSDGITVDDVDNCNDVLTLNASVVNGDACTAHGPMATRTWEKDRRSSTARCWTGYAARSP